VKKKLKINLQKLKPLKLNLKFPLLKQKNKKKSVDNKEAAEKTAIKPSEEPKKENIIELNRTENKENKIAIKNQNANEAKENKEEEEEKEKEKEEDEEEDEKEEEEKEEEEEEEEKDSKDERINSEAEKKDSSSENNKETILPQNIEKVPEVKEKALEEKYSVEHNKRSEVLEKPEKTRKS